jgi:ATP-binding cassette, subfamily B, multidrug efflux pump
MAKPDIDDTAIQQACDVACLAGDIAEMPDGLDTLLGERGINLSGGQKQRLMLARALARDPVVLILDDTLSSVDADTEQAILHELRRVMVTRTSIIISHRVSAIAHADQIIVLEQGRIVERGQHEELISRNGLYKRMYKRQMLEAKLNQDE